MYIRKATAIDAYYISNNLSEHDILEFQASHGTTDRLRETIQSHLSDDTVVIVNSLGEVYAFGGCSPEGGAWFLTSSLVDSMSLKHKVEFMRLIKKYRDLMLERHEVLYNMVWSGNKPHLKFLKALGATFSDLGDFKYFTIRRQ